MVEMFVLFADVDDPTAEGVGGYVSDITNLTTV